MLVFNNVSPNNFSFRHKEVNNFILRHFVVDLVFLNLLVIKFEDYRNILLLHLANCSFKTSRISVRKSPSFLEVFHCHILGLIGIFDLNKLSNINKSVKIVWGCEGSRHCVAWCVIGLRKSINSFTSHHFLYNYLSHSLRSEISMYCKEINFANLNLFATYDNFLWLPHNRRKNFSIFLISNQDMQILNISRGRTGPSKLFFRVQKSKISSCIFDIVVH
jgi:hypothetical protein